MDLDSLETNSMDDWPDL